MVCRWSSRRTPRRRRIARLGRVSYAGVSSLGWGLETERVRPNRSSTRTRTACGGHGSLATSRKAKTLRTLSLDLNAERFIDRCRRIARVADRDCGGLNWAGKRTYRDRRRRRDVRPEPEFLAMRFNERSRRRGVAA